MPGVFLPLGGENEEAFINTIFENDLKQIAPPPQGRNHLDLVFVLNEITAHCSSPIPEETLDRTSLRHAPIIVNFQMREPSKERLSFMNFGRTNLSGTKNDLDRCTFSMVTEEEALLEQWHENLRATSKIEENISKLKRIVARNTPIKKVQRSWLSRHPWLRNSDAYNASNNFKIRAEKNFRSDPSEINRDTYKRACAANSDVYENERANFLNKVFDETKGTKGNSSL